MPGDDPAPHKGAVPDGPQAGAPPLGGGLGPLFGQYRHPQSLGGGLQQRFGADALPRGMQGQPLGSQGVFQHGPGGTARFPHQQRRRRQLFQRQRGLCRQRVRGRQHRAQAVGAQLLAVQFGQAGAVFQQGQVQAVFTQGGGQAAAVGHRDLQFDAGVLGRKLPGQPRQQRPAQGDGGPHPDHAQGIPVPQPGFHAVEGIQQVHGLGIKPPPALGGGKMAVHPLEQPHAVVLFQFLHGAGYGGLSHVQDFRRPGHIARTVHFRKNAQMA